MTDPAMSTQDALSNMARMHLAVASNIDGQRQFGEQIMAEMLANSSDARVRAACEAAAPEWERQLRALYNLLQDLADQANAAIIGHGAADLDRADSVDRIGRTMSPAGTFIVG